MKRKLNDVDAPAATVTNEPAKTGTSQEAASSTHATSFDSLGLESRLLQALAKENFSAPTQIQAKAIPIALEGKDILARSKTGSGKTAAYVLPILQSVLQKKNKQKVNHATTALILVPTRELAQQVSMAISIFTAFCSKNVRTINLAQKMDDAVQRSRLAETPDIVVATPARAAENIKSSTFLVEGLTHLVIDEADLVLSFGHDKDLQIIAEAVPKGLQTSLMSATLTTEVNTLEGLFCRDPVVLDLQETTEDGGGVEQYLVKCAEDEKFLLAYVTFKLELIKGKSIIFVGDIDRSYRLKLFLEQFGIKSCVLNSELPVNSRIHAIEQFNKNVYDIIIAADENEILEVRVVKPAAPTIGSTGGEAFKGDPDTIDDALRETVETRNLEGNVNGEDEEPPTRKRQKSKKSKEYGVSRGIDFQNVSCVLNFDLPTTTKSYTHRVGRTARAGKGGIALSFAVPRELYRKHPSTTLASAQFDEEVLEGITKDQQKRGKELKPYHFDKNRVDSFRYRMNDALRAVTRIAIREARTRELRQELLKSEKLKRHFEENPEDLQHLRHDGELRATRIQQHLRHVPDYLMPSNGKQGIAGGGVGFVGLRKTTDNRIRKARMQNRLKGKGRKASVKRSDPLKTFNARGRR